MKNDLIRNLFFDGRTDYAVPGALMGIEVEVEKTGGRFPHPEVFQKTNWIMKEDGSLRSGMEFVSEHPQTRTVLIEELKELDNKLREHIRPLFSDRTSVHVHLNVLNMTLQQLQALCYLYYLVEIPLLRFCGETREGNNFCLRSVDSDEALWHLKNFFVRKGVWSNNAADLRYTALNVIYCVKRYGSVEFRGMRGTLDLDILDTWLSIIESMYLYTMKYSLKDIRNVSGNIFNEVFTNKQRDVLFYTEINRDLAMSKSLAVELLI